MNVKKILEILFVLVLLYIGISDFGFKLRNPKSNDTSFIRHPIAVLTWVKMERYQ